MAANEELQFLYAQLLEHKSDPIIPELYEIVQYSENIISRLYMMITVGALYMELNQAPRVEIMNDMMEMCRGVQHPIKGLFLRYYLVSVVKNFLPDTNSLQYTNVYSCLI